MRVPRWLMLVTGLFSVGGGGYALGVDLHGTGKHVLSDLIVIGLGFWWLSRWRAAS